MCVLVFGHAKSGFNAQIYPPILIPRQRGYFWTLANKTNAIKPPFQIIKLKSVFQSSL